MTHNYAEGNDLTAAIPPPPDRRFRFIQPLLPALSDVLRLYAPSYADGMLTNARTVGRFEDATREFLGVRHCVAVGSCTSGLMLTLRSLGLSGEVVVPSFTFFATGHAILWNGLTPVFADCDPESWTVNVEDVERRITSRTSAILAVHLYGNPCAVENLTRLAERYALKLIFDAAHAFGSSRHGTPVGGFGDAEVFSLTPTKLLVCGEGGLIATNDSLLAAKLRAARNYGDTGAYDPELLGLSARMPEYNAALGLAGLPLVEGKVSRHNQIAAQYNEQLSGLPGTSFQKVSEGDVSAYKDYSFLLDEQTTGMSRDDLMKRLLEENIETKRYFYPPLHRQKVFQAYYDANHMPLPVTDRVSRSVISLPIYHDLPDEIVERVTRTIRRLL